VTTSTQPTATPGGSTGPAPVSESTGTTLTATSGRRSRLKRTNPVFWVVIVLLALAFIGPLLWMLVTAFKTGVEARSVPPTFFPSDPTLAAFRTLLTDKTNPVLLWFANSMIAATAHSLLVVVVCSMAGYALARMEFPFKKLIFGMIIATLFIPGFIFLMPNFLILDQLGWLDTLWSLIVPGAAGAFGVFFMRQFFSTIPIALEESARIDGARPWRIFFSIVLPNSRPALVTLAVLSFLANWNDFVWPIYVLFSPERLTLPVGLSKLQGSYTIDYSVMMAGAAIAAVPVLILYIFVQRFVIEGVASSGIKG
jgi:multiple sugar transport system permease protein